MTNKLRGEGDACGVGSIAAAIVREIRSKTLSVVNKYQSQNY